MEWVKVVSRVAAEHCAVSPRWSWRGNGVFERVEMECQPEPSSARAARELVAAALAAWEMDDLVEVAQLLTSELVTNVVLHAKTAFQVAVEAEPPVARVEVHDAVEHLPVRAPAPLESEHGRGLMLVEALASQWGSRVADGGKVVWFSLRSVLVEPAAGSSPVL